MKMSGLVWGYFRRNILELKRDEYICDLGRYGKIWFI